MRSGIPRKYRCRRADADFIAAGQLIDCKATIHPEHIGAPAIHQLAGYLLLSYEDHYHLDSVSLYLARQGQLIGWTSQEFLDLLGARQPLDQLRADCRAALAPPPPPEPTQIPRQVTSTQESLFDADS
ncbi:hypothetical protein GCM10022403_018060 [Streptomyces coacervatus]|uniref:Uncharacterized protein n=1 Tax=Streptomyces coacervatus TaxID=647381 RepID=A0ABP7H6M6_9ACTN|nr:hypothetical protein [Streptomyces coacervatus]MDF2271571.1 hypothetical protein [Streptomyces coacervatus]